MTGFDQFTRWHCPKCAAPGFDGWNKTMFDGIVRDPDDLPNPLIMGDQCQACGWPAVILFTTADVAPRVILSPDGSYEHELVAMSDIVDPMNGQTLRPSPARDADWSQGCLRAKGQLQ